MNRKLKHWTIITLLGLVSVNVTALVTAILVIGIRSGTFPTIEPFSSLINLAADILKTVFAA